MLRRHSSVNITLMQIRFNAKLVSGFPVIVLWFMVGTLWNHMALDLEERQPHEFIWFSVLLDVLSAICFTFSYPNKIASIWNLIQSCMWGLENIDIGKVRKQRGVRFGQIHSPRCTTRQCIGDLYHGQYYLEPYCECNEATRSKLQDKSRSSHFVYHSVYVT